MPFMPVILIPFCRACSQNGYLKKMVIYDIFDFYADHLRRTPKIIIRIIRSVDLWAIGQSDAVIIVDDARVKQIEDSSPRKKS